MKPINLLLCILLFITSCDEQDPNFKGCVYADTRDALTFEPVQNVAMTCATEKDFIEGNYKQGITNINEWSNFRWEPCDKCK